MKTERELSERAYALGQNAASEGRSQAPAMDGEFMTMMRESKGVDWTTPLQAFARGYQAKVDADGSSPDTGT